GCARWGTPDGLAPAPRCRKAPSAASTVSHGRSEFATPGAHPDGPPGTRLRREFPNARLRCAVWGFHSAERGGVPNGGVARSTCGELIAPGAVKYPSGICDPRNSGLAVLRHGVPGLCPGSLSMRLAIAPPGLFPAAR